MKKPPRSNLHPLFEELVGKLAVQADLIAMGVEPREAMDTVYGEGAYDEAGRFVNEIEKKHEQDR